MKIFSSAFREGEQIPAVFSCKGQDISPPLEWTGVPDNTESFVLISDDPDAPVGTWVHWVYYNIPSDLRSLPEGLDTGEFPPSGGVQGITSFGRTGYGGPCPPSGTHRYFFKLYALDCEINPAGRGGKEDVIAAMQGHILEEAVLMGTFSR